MAYGAAAQNSQPYMQQRLQGFQSQPSQGFSRQGDSSASGTQLFGSHSGGGYEDTPSGSCFSIDICPDLLLAALAAAAAAGFLAIFIAITMAGKRKKRSDKSEVTLLNSLSDILNLGNKTDH